jgi:hypothetical protein
VSMVNSLSSHLASQQSDRNDESVPCAIGLCPDLP